MRRNLFLFFAMGILTSIVLLSGCSVSNETGSQRLDRGEIPFQPGDVVVEQPEDQVGDLILDYDPAERMYLGIIIFRNMNGTWGHRLYPDEVVWSKESMEEHDAFVIAQIDPEQLLTDYTSKEAFQANRGFTSSSLGTPSSFSPVSFSGNGSDRISFILPDAGFYSFSGNADFHGFGRFFVWIFREGTQVAFLNNMIASYRGTTTREKKWSEWMRTKTVLLDAGTYIGQVTAAGPWSISIRSSEWLPANQIPIAGQAAVPRTPQTISPVQPGSVSGHRYSYTGPVYFERGGPIIGNKTYEVDFYGSDNFYLFSDARPNHPFTDNYYCGKWSQSGNEISVRVTSCGTLDQAILLYKGITGRFHGRKSYRCLDSECMGIVDESNPSEIYIQADMLLEAVPTPTLAVTAVPIPAAPPVEATPEPSPPVPASVIAGLTPMLEEDFVFAGNHTTLYVEQSNPPLLIEYSFTVQNVTRRRVVTDPLTGNDEIVSLTYPDPDADFFITVRDPKNNRIISQSGFGGHGSMGVSSRHIWIREPGRVQIVFGGNQVKVHLEVRVNTTV